MGQLVTSMSALALIASAMACNGRGDARAESREEGTVTTPQERASAYEVVTRDLQKVAELQARVDDLLPAGIQPRASLDALPSGLPAGMVKTGHPRPYQAPQSYDQFLKSVESSREPSTTEFSVDEYVVVGVVTSRKRRRALVQDPDGEQHIVGPRSPLGSDGGVVLRVDRRGVVVRDANGETRHLSLGEDSL